MTNDQKLQRSKIAARVAKRIDDALRKEIEENGPMLIWLGDGEYPRCKCGFRGLAIGNGRSRLTEWLKGVA